MLATPISPRSTATAAAIRDARLTASSDGAAARNAPITSSPGSGRHEPRRDQTTSDRGQFDSTAWPTYQEAIV